MYDVSAMTSDSSLDKTSDIRAQLETMSATILPQTTLREAELKTASNQAAESTV